MERIVFYPPCAAPQIEDGHSDPLMQVNPHKSGEEVSSSFLKFIVRHVVLVLVFLIQAPSQLGSGI
jgi:hypothetical protein